MSFGQWVSGSEKQKKDKFFGIFTTSPAAVLSRVWSLRNKGWGLRRCGTFCPLNSGPF